MSKPRDNTRILNPSEKLEQALIALRLEVDSSIVDDVTAKINAYVDFRVTSELEHLLSGNKMYPIPFRKFVEKRLAHLKQQQQERGTEEKTNE